MRQASTPSFQFPHHFRWLKQIHACLLLGALTAGLFVLGAAESGNDQTLRRLKQMARTYTHFSRSVIIHNRSLRFQTISTKRWAENDPLAVKQDYLLVQLRALSTNREALAALLQYRDPKVRTL